MFVTLALVILCAAIVVAFSQEFSGSFKKLFAIKGVKIFLPLFVASWLVYSFEYWSLYAVYYCRETLQHVINVLVYMMPFQQYAQPVAEILLLAVVALLPVFLLDLYLRRKSYKGYQYPYLTSTLLFIVTATLILAL